MKFLAGVLGIAALLAGAWFLWGTSRSVAPDSIVVPDFPGFTLREMEKDVFPLASYMHEDEGTHVFGVYLNADGDPSAPEEIAILYARKDGERVVEFDREELAGVLGDGLRVAFSSGADVSMLYAQKESWDFVWGKDENDFLHILFVESFLRGGEYVPFVSLLDYFRLGTGVDVCVAVYVEHVSPARLNRSYAIAKLFEQSMIDANRE